MVLEETFKLHEFIKYKYNIYTDKEKLNKLNIILSNKENVEKSNLVNMFCDAIFGIDYKTIIELASKEIWTNFQEEECCVRKAIQKKLIELENETKEHISKLTKEIEDLKSTNEELRTSYWNLKHNN